MKIQSLASNVHLVKGFIHSLAWLIGGWSMLYLMDPSPAKLAYGYLVGWWFALYIGFVFGIRIKSILFATLAYLFLEVLSVSFGWQWLYHDLPSQFTFELLEIFIIQAPIFVSPILVNEAVLYFRMKFPGSS